MTLPPALPLAWAGIAFVGLFGAWKWLAAEVEARRRAHATNRAPA